MQAKKYKLIIDRDVYKQLDRLPVDISKKLLFTIKQLSTNPRPNGYIKLKGSDNYCVRKGNYRVIYRVYDNQITVVVLAVGHRRDIYK